MADQVKYTNKLKGDKVLVFGGTSGIGYGVAEALVEHGCVVIISSSSQDRINKKVAALQALYPSAKDRISGRVCDLSDQAKLDSNVKTLLEQCGQLDHIIHTAGDRLAVKPVSEIDLDFIKQAGMVRFFAPLIIAKYAAKHLSGGPKSSLTLTTGAVSERPTENWSVVGSYATGLQGMVRCLALDLKPIRVNLVSAGPVDTELWDGFGMTEEQKAQFLQNMEKWLPTGKVGTPEELAEPYLYYLRDRNITGTMVSSSSGSMLVGPS